MKCIEKLQNSNTTNSNNISGPVKADPEYMLIVDANNLAVDIDTEICKYSSYWSLCLFNFSSSLFNCF